MHAEWLEHQLNKDGNNQENNPLIKTSILLGTLNPGNFFGGLGQESK